MKYFLFALLFLLLISCNQKPKANVNELFEVDKQFSKTAEKIGFNKAFIEFAHDNAVLLRENNMPLVGKKAIIKVFEKANSKGIQFTWSPINGDIAQSGELGFTYGTYILKRDTIVEKGTYVSIWKKDLEGNWKYILDSGNE